MKLLPLEDSRWMHYRAGYNRAPLDVRPWIQGLFAAKVDPLRWLFLWDELHHQGDLGEASYAVVPYLVEYIRQTGELDWNIFAFVATVELERRCNGNPPIPEELDQPYAEALQSLPRLAIDFAASIQPWPEELVMGVCACLAVSQGQQVLARAYLDLSSKEAKLFLNEL